MPFTPGQLTKSQSDELNQLQRDVQSLLNMTVTGGTISRLGGCINIAVGAAPAAATSDEFDAQITARSPTSPNFENPAGSSAGQYQYSWRKVSWGVPLDPVTGDPTLRVDPAGLHGDFNLKRNYNNYSSTALAIGQVVRIKPMPGFTDRYVTDGVGGMSSFTFTFLAPWPFTPYLVWRTVKLAIRDGTVIQMTETPYGGPIQDNYGWNGQDNTNLPHG
jgi:hypothetical protein